MGNNNSQNQYKMKVIYLYLIMITIILSAFAQAEDKDQKIDKPGTTEQWSVFELILKGPKDGNLFIEVSLSAEFRNGDRKINVTGFYDGNGSWQAIPCPAYSESRQALNM